MVPLLWSRTGTAPSTSGDHVTESLDVCLERRVLVSRQGAGLSRIANTSATVIAFAAEEQRDIERARARHQTRRCRAGLAGSSGKSRHGRHRTGVDTVPAPALTRSGCPWRPRVSRSILRRASSVSSAGGSSFCASRYCLRSTARRILDRREVDRFRRRILASRSVAPSAQHRHRLRPATLQARREVQAGSGDCACCSALSASICSSSWRRTLLRAVRAIADRVAGGFVRACAARLRCLRTARRRRSFRPRCAVRAGGVRPNACTGASPSASCATVPACGSAAACAACHAFERCPSEDARAIRASTRCDARRRAPRARRTRGIDLLRTFAALVVEFLPRVSCSPMRKRLFSKHCALHWRR